MFTIFPSELLPSSQIAGRWELLRYLRLLPKMDLALANLNAAFIHPSFSDVESSVPIPSKTSSFSYFYCGIDTDFIGFMSFVGSAQITSLKGLLFPRKNHLLVNGITLNTSSIPILRTLVPFRASF